MTATTIPELSAEIAALKDALTLNKGDKSKELEFQYDGNHEGKTEAEKKGKTETFKVSDLKAALISEEPKVVTTALLPFKFTERFASIYEELQKERWTEYLEGLGLDGFAAAFEKQKEGEADWKNWLTAAIGGLFIPMVGAVIALMFLTNFKNFQRGLQKILFNWVLGWIPRLGPYLRNKILAMEPDGRFPRLQPAQTVRDREAGNVPGATAATPPDPSTFDALKRALGDINRRIINFNKAVGKMKSKAQLDKLAKGVEAVTKATDAAKPTDIETLATAIGTLATSQRNFDPKKLPKPRTLANAAKEAERLAKAGDDVKTAFDNLKAAAQAAERVIAAG
ncbi:hypothetical protein ACWGN5_37820 [Streptomyces sp. NPDC055815]